MHIVWDWNGTILGDSGALIAATIDALGACGFPPVTRAESMTLAIAHGAVHCSAGVASGPRCRTSVQRSVDRLDDIEHCDLRRGAGQHSTHRSCLRGAHPPGPRQRLELFFAGSYGWPIQLLTTEVTGSAVC